MKKIILFISLISFVVLTGCKKDPFRTYPLPGGVHFPYDTTLLYADPVPGAPVVTYDTAARTITTTTYVDLIAWPPSTLQDNGYAPGVPTQLYIPGTMALSNRTHAELEGATDNQFWISLNGTFISSGDATATLVPVLYPGGPQVLPVLDAAGNYILPPQVWERFQVTITYSPPPGPFRVYDGLYSFLYNMTDSRNDYISTTARLNQDGFRSQTVKGS